MCLASKYDFKRFRLTISFLLIPGHGSDSPESAEHELTMW